jgi:photosystem II stability/assembly factor-like uncharacterized protein
MRSVYFLTWVCLATPLFCAWKPAGPFGGSARAIAIDPQDRNVLLAGARDSLLFRSDNAGASWRVLPFPAGAGVFNALIIHPAESGHVYAGLDASDSQDSGVYESKDGGGHWSALPGMRGLRIESLAMWSANSRVLAAGTARGVFLTEDAGQNWRRVSDENDPEMQDITALSFDPRNSKIIYAGTPHLPWKTVDGGTHWRSIRDGLIDDSDIFSIRVNPERPELLLASACSGIYRSDDAGASWTKLNGIPGTHRRTHIIAEDPRRSETIFAGTTLGLFKSADDGHTWRHLTYQQVNGMVFDPGDPGTVYLATEYAGILKSQDSGETFRPVNIGFTNHNVTQITGRGKQLFASSPYEGLYGGVFVSDDDGLTWTLRASERVLRGRNLNSLSAGPARSGVLFAASDEAVLQSLDNGKTWLSLPVQPRARSAGTGRIRIHCLQALQADKLILLAGTQSGLFRSSNGGASWNRATEAGLANLPVLSIYTPPRGSLRLAARTSSGLFLSDDEGRTWRATQLPGSGHFVYDVALPADRDDRLLAATSRGLLQSLDGGGQWRLITDGIPATTVDSVRFHPQRKLEAFLVQYGKIYRSQDGGSSWMRFPSDGLENSPVRTLWFAPDLPGRIFALSPGRGALVFDLPDPDDRVVSGNGQLRGKR